MINAAYMAIYGMLLISGLFMLPAWLAIGRVARSEGDRDYALVADALALNSLATVIIFGVRLIFSFQAGSWATVPGWLGAVVMVGLAFFEASKIMLMRVRHHHGKIGTWRAFAVASVLWALFAIVWTFGAVR